MPRSPASGASTPRAGLLAWLLLGSGGCSSAAPEEWIPFPEGQATSYVLGGSDAQGHLLGLVAASGAQPTRARGYPAAAVVHLLVYGESLAELGLTAGEVGPAPACARRCDLLRPVSSWERPMVGGEWSPAPIPDAIADRLVPDRSTHCGCAGLTFEDLDLGTEQPVIFAVPRTEGALIGTRDGALFHVARDHRVERICGPGLEYFSSGYASPAGLTVWLAGTQFGSVDLSAAVEDQPCPYRPGPTRATRDTILDLDGSRDGDPFEIFALSSTGGVARFDGAAWTELAVVDRDLVGGYFGDVQWIAPGSAAAVLQGHQVALVSGGSARTELVPFVTDTYGLQTAALSERFGLVLGGYHVGLLARREGVWQLIGANRRNNVLGLIVELDDRIFFALGRGVIGQLVGGTQVCPDVASTFARVYRRPVVLSENEFLMGFVESPTDDPLVRIVFVRIHDGCND